MGYKKKVSAITHAINEEHDFGIIWIDLKALKYKVIFMKSLECLRFFFHFFFLIMSLCQNTKDSYKHDTSTSSKEDEYRIPKRADIK